MRDLVTKTRKTREIISKLLINPMRCIFSLFSLHFSKEIQNRCRIFLYEQDTSTFLVDM